MADREIAMHKLLASFSLLALAGWISGCLGLQVHTDHDAAVDFAALSSFAWLEAPLREAPRDADAPAVDPFTHNTLLDKRVREAVEAGLASRGYVKAAEGAPADFQLRYEVVSREVVRDTPVYVGGGLGHRYHGGGVVYSGTRSYQEGTLILDVIDPGSATIAWRGWAASRLRDGNIDAKLVARTIEAILAEFPPEPRGSPGSGP